MNFADYFKQIDHTYDITKKLKYIADGTPFRVVDNQPNELKVVVDKKRVKEIMHGLSRYGYNVSLDSPAASLTREGDMKGAIIKVTIASELTVHTRHNRPVVS